MPFDFFWLLSCTHIACRQQAAKHRGVAKQNTRRKAKKRRRAHPNELVRQQPARMSCRAMRPCGFNNIQYSHVYCGNSPTGPLREFQHTRRRLRPRHLTRCTLGHLLEEGHSIAIATPATRTRPPRTSTKPRQKNIYTQEGVLTEELGGTKPETGDSHISVFVLSQNDNM